ncbi:YegS/Rv2252/BmrU family lipid kinase [Aquisalibacillus elongatus]|uniref:YegS/Rv2252/BmrU family lipid kinase n=1 Tax=Aquisalibacillus elongatus TaxID=485577 RepID=A0A3N5C771_9BACI|nr:YegS/Rv2252/BmrU family lipid kinase [Aquisalibacillus elongatus]
MFIINPVAGSGKGEQVVQNYLVEHPELKGSFKTYVTEYPGHAKELARQVATLYSESIKLLIVVGGDGTMYEVLNGLKDFSGIPLAFIPVGSGNDFARGCAMPLKPTINLHETLHDVSLHPYWAGKYKTDFKHDRHEKLFASSLGFGFDAEVASLANESRAKKWLNKARLKYLVYIYGLILMTFKFKPKKLKLIYDGKERDLTGIWMLTVSNHPYFGGGMKIAPNATINKQTFYITIVHQISKWKLLCLFLTVFFGKHLQLKEVETFQVTDLELTSDQKLTYHADGFTDSCYRCLVRKDPNARLVKRKL